MIWISFCFLDSSRLWAFEKLSASSSAVSFSYMTIQVMLLLPKLTSKWRMGFSEEDGSGFGGF